MKRKWALLGSNPPRNSRLETHPDGPGAGRNWPAPATRRLPSTLSSRIGVDLLIPQKPPTIPWPGAIVDNKRLSAVLEQVKAQQAAYPARQQRGHTARQRPPNNLEAPGLPSKGRAPRHRAAAAVA